MSAIPPPPYPSVVTTALVVVSTIFPVVSLVSILLRIRARKLAKQHIGSDDICIYVSWLLTLGLSILVWYYAPRIGINYYNTNFLDGTEGSLELIFLSSCYVTFPLAAVKIGVLLFYKRIFGSKRAFVVVVWAIIALVSVWAILFFLLVLLEIDPIAFPLTKTKLKYNSSSLGLAQVASSFVLDIIVLCLPLPIIKSLNMRTSRKIAVMLIFWLGGLCTVAAIVRTVLLKESINGVVHSSSYDRVSSQSKQYIFMVLEPNLSILAACLPSYGPLASLHSTQSLIRSVRSVRSLFRSESSSTSQDRKTDNTVISDQSGRSVGTYSAESQLGTNWTEKADQEVYVSYDRAASS